LPTSGTAVVNGYDIIRHEQLVRRQLGVLFGGDKGLYNQLNAIENMRYFGRLYGMDDDAIRCRTALLLDQVQLADRAGERVESYSRGMKQRLHIAKTLIHDPRIVILDEPTIGLDPGAAIGVRELIAELVPEHTVLLTTHDMHEADLLCREIAIIDQGRIVAEGTPTALKAATEIDRRVAITLADGANVRHGELEHQLARLENVIAATHRFSDTGQAVIEVSCVETTGTLDAALALLRERGAGIAEIDIREPSLEDVFLLATGREFEPERTNDGGAGS
jgi:ABC-2 type transport system ATP-binding protein